MQDYRGLSVSPNGSRILADIYSEGLKLFTVPAEQTNDAWVANNPSIVTKTGLGRVRRAAFHCVVTPCGTLLDYVRSLFDRRVHCCGGL